MGDRVRDKFSSESREMLPPSFCPEGQFLSVELSRPLIFCLLRSLRLSFSRDRRRRPFLCEVLAGHQTTRSASAAVGCDDRWVLALSSLGSVKTHSPERRGGMLKAHWPFSLLVFKFCKPGASGERFARLEPLNLT
jgi:hypothetical protein